MISLAYHQGLRVSELINLQWDAFDRAGNNRDQPQKGWRRWRAEPRAGLTLASCALYAPKLMAARMYSSVSAAAI
jgi:integrase